MLIITVTELADARPRYHVQMPAEAARIPQLSLLALFLRFVRLGALAWGGPIPQIEMLRRELVEEERWISPEKFQRAYALYQALPGPEAQELCVYFGTLARGRWGGLVAGLGFLLPGFVLILIAAWAYLHWGLQSPGWWAAFAGIQAAVLALIARAVWRLGRGALRDAALWIIAGAVCVASLAGWPFALLLIVAGASYECLERSGRVWASVILLGCAAWWVWGPPATPSLELNTPQLAQPADPLAVFFAGLRSGSLSFGGAYTAIPWLLQDAVEQGAWLSREQFLDGLAIGGVLPAPLIIFGTFVGYLAAGLLGALAITAGIFLPAFGLTLLGHEFLERVIAQQWLQRALAGVMAGVIGLISATAIGLAPSCVRDLPTALIAVGALVLLSWLRVRWAPAVVVLLAGLAGWLSHSGSS